MEVEAETWAETNGPWLPLALGVINGRLAPDDWVLDSGSYTHVTGRQSLFETMRPAPPGKRVMGVGGGVTVAGIGTVKIPIACEVDGIVYNKTFTIQNVSYAPGLPFNIISCRALTLTKEGEKAGIRFMMDGHDLEIVRTETGQVIATADCRTTDLYVLSRPKAKATREQRPQPYAFTAIPSDVPIETHHRRLGHLGEGRLRRLLRRLNVSSAEDPLPPCESCSRAGMKRRNFKNSGTRSTKPLQRVFVDLAGPVNAYDGKKKVNDRFALTITDDYTRYRWVRVLRHKNDAARELQIWKTQVEKELEHELLAVRRDNGGEFDNKLLNEFFRETGVRVEPTAPYNPEQNGVAERGMNILFTAVRAILDESNLGQHCFAEILISVTDIVNYCPTSANPNDQPPYERLYGRPPPIEHLRVLGCECWKPRPRSDYSNFRKLDPRADKCYLLGSVAKHQYRVWNTCTERVELVRDLHFNEDIFGPGGEVPETVRRPAFCDEVRIQDTLAHRAKRRRYSTIEGETLAALSVKPAAIDGGLVLIVEDGEINEAERFSEESTQTQVAQSLASVDHDDWSAVIECLAALSALEKNQDKFENHVVDHAAGGAYEPKNYEDAVTCADASRWIPSMDEEVKEIIANDVWDVVNPPPGVSILTGKFAYKVKTNADGEVTRYKSRWCARGFEQELGVDVLETFASVVKPMSYKLLFALACLLGWSIEQMDVKTAFLYGKIDTDVYMELPPNIKDQYPGKICKLKKALYGLKQSPRIWYLTLSQALRPMGFVAISEDHSVFVNRDKRLVLATYVDDLLILGKDQEAIASVKSALSEHFKMSDLGPVAHYLGVKVIREDTSRGSRIKLTQRAYAEKVLRTFGMADCTSVATPMDENLVLEPSKEASDSQDRKWYQRAVGSLMYLMLCTRPDIAYAVSQLGRFAANPSQKHHAALKRLFRYLKGTSDYGLVIDTQGRPDILTGYTDANWGRDDDRRSTGGYVFTFAGTAISWKSKRQATVSLSSCEAEYIAESEAAKEAIWLQRLLSQLRVDLSQPSASEPVTILGDNRGALALAKNPMYHARTKHVDIRYHFVREKVEERLVKMEWIAGGLNPADGLTKPLGKTKFESFRRMVGLRRIDD